jgi:hypothetical protein
MAGLAGSHRRVHQAQVDHLDAGTSEPRPHLCHVSLKPLLLPRELRPVSIQANPA